MKKKAFNILWYKPILNILQWSKRIVLPGFDGMPLYDVARFFIQGIFKGSITSRASSISFSFFLAIFPMIIVFFTLIPFIPIENFQNILLGFIESITPNSTEEVIHTTLIDIIARPRGSLLSLTFFFSDNFCNQRFRQHYRSL